MKVPQACSDALDRHLRPELFRALCDPRRMSLLARLCVAAEPLSVSDAASCCGVHISGVSRHLSMLRRAGIVSASKSGREVRYRLDFDALIGALRGLADAIEECRQDCCSPKPNQEQTDESK